MNDFEKCKSCINYILSDNQPKGGVLWGCKYDRPLMPCHEYQARDSRSCRTCGKRKTEYCPNSEATIIHAEGKVCRLYSV